MVALDILGYGHVSYFGHMSSEHKPYPKTKECTFFKEKKIHLLN